MNPHSWKMLLVGSIVLCLVAAAAAEIHKGKIVEAANQKLVIIGSNGDNEEFAVPDGTKILLDGKKAQLSDLQSGFVVQVAFSQKGGKQTATSIEARTSE